MINLYFQEMDNPTAKSEAFLRRILGEYLNVKGWELNFGKNDYGKPYLEDYSNIHFNISHTKDCIICAISDNPIGVDIEKVKSFNKRIVEKFFTENEQNYIFSKDESQDIRFYEIWTRKEAYVKWLGKGMAVPLKSFEVLGDPKITTRYIGSYIVSMCSSNLSKEDAEIVTCSPFDIQFE